MPPSFKPHRHLLILFVSSLAGLAWPPVSLAAPEEPVLRQASPYDEAYRLLGNGKAAEALTRIDAALAADPSNAGLYNLRGLAASQLGREKDAETSFLKVIELAPDVPMGYNNLATFFSQRGRHAEAAQLFRQALQREPHNFTALVGLGVTLAALKDYAGAAPYLEEAFCRGGFRPPSGPQRASLPGGKNAGSSGEPCASAGDFQTGYDYARVLRELKRPLEAEKVLAITKPPREPALAAKYFALSAVVAEDNGDRKRAAELYARAYQLAPESFDVYLALVRAYLDAGPSPNLEANHQSLPGPPAHLAAEQYFALGLLFASRGAYARAVPYFEQTLRLEPSSYAATYNLALAYKGAGKAEAAIKLVEQWLEQKPTAELHDLLASLEETAGRYLDAALHYQQAVQLDPANEQYYFDLGAEYLAHFTFGPALEVFRVGTQKFPNSSRQYVGLGFAHYVQREYLEAAEAFLRGLEIDPSSASAFRGWNSLPGFLGSTEWERVLPRLDRLAELHPDNAEVLYCYGLSLLRYEIASGKGTNFDRARESLERAVRLKPGLAEVHFELGNLYAARNENEKAVGQYLEAIRLDPDSEMAHYRLGQTYRDLNRLDMAQRELARYGELSRQRREQIARSRSAIKQFIVAQSAASGSSSVSGQKETPHP